MSLNSYIAKQFSFPKGLGGHMISFVMNRQNRPLYEETIRLMSRFPGGSVLDIGCGNGYVLNLLAGRRDGEFTGIDPSEGILRSARRRNRARIKSGKMRFFCRDVRSLSFPDASFDRAYTINTVYFWDDLAASMREIARVLKPGGVFVNALYTGEVLASRAHTQFGYRIYTSGELIEAGESAGLSVKSVSILQGRAIGCIYTKPVVLI